MIEALYVDETEDTPKVELDASENVFRLSGKSLPEDSVAFYEPLVAWIKTYAGNPNSETHFEFELEYFNSTSSKHILEIIGELEKIEKAGQSKVRVVWAYHHEDEMIEERGQEIKTLVEVPFDLKPLQ